MKIFIAIPAYNEGKAISKVIKSIKKEGYKNIVIADDCSKDNTYNEAKKAGAVVLRHFINRGAGAATKTAIDYALLNRAYIIITMDSDGQHDPKDIKNLIKPILDKKADVVIGSRLLNPKGMPWYRRFFNFGGNVVTFVLFGLWVTDTQSGFKAFTKEAAKKIQIKMDRFEFCSEIIGEIKKNKLRVAEIPIKVIYNEYSLSKGQNFMNGLKMIVKLIIRRLIK